MKVITCHFCGQVKDTYFKVRLRNKKYVFVCPECFNNFEFDILKVLVWDEWTWGMKYSWVYGSGRTRFIEGLPVKFDKYGNRKD